jgi:PTH1 family peptidyl-tRNA hydrolase
MKLIVGLGNPGATYASNRHNIGFMCLGYFARAQGIKLNKKQANARVGSGEVADVRVVLARPQTYVNASGESVSRLVKKFEIDPGGLVVIHDDLDLPLGKLRIRQGGSSGGHRGIESIILCLGSKDFVRVRVGIGRPASQGGISEASEADTIDYVLSNFAPEQKETITAAIPRVSEAIYCLLTEGVAATMNRYN